MAGKVRVFLSTHLRDYTQQRGQVEAEGATVAQVLAAVERTYPGLRFRIVDEQDQIRPHINIFVGQDRVTTLNAPVGPGEDVHLLAALSGG